MARKKILWLMTSRSVTGSEQGNAVENLGNVQRNKEACARGRGPNPYPVHSMAQYNVGKQVEHDEYV